MNDDEHFTDMDMSDVIDDTEHYADAEFNTEPTDSEFIQESEVISEEIVVEKKPQGAQVNKSEVVRSTRLPIARIKNIMKQDPDVNVISADAAFLVTKATEFFLETIAKEAYNSSAKKKKNCNKERSRLCDQYD